MHRLTGAKLTKLIDLKLVDRNAGIETAAPALKRRRILSQTAAPVKQELFYWSTAKLK